MCVCVCDLAANSLAHAQPPSPHQQPPATTGNVDNRTNCVMHAPFHPFILRCQFHNLLMFKGLFRSIRIDVDVFFLSFDVGAKVHKWKVPWAVSNNTTNNNNDNECNSSKCVDHALKLLQMNSINLNWW